ncbi:hypothetical protein HYQ46_006581 [Verticillium longisporum]|nr:hypothetical protein HYQ46_006581 [Verticillium longisporum]
MYRAAAWLAPSVMRVSSRANISLRRFATRPDGIVFSGSSSSSSSASARPRLGSSSLSMTSAARWPAVSSLDDANGSSRSAAEVEARCFFGAVAPPALEERPRLAPVVCFGGMVMSRGGLAEEEDLELVVDGQDTSTGNTTEDVGTGTLEERLDTLLGDDLATSVEGTGVVDGLTRGHHHATTDGIKGVRSDTGTGGDGPTKSEGGEEVALKVTGEDDGLDRVGMKPR